MNFDTHAELKATISRWLMRSDLTEEIPSFISLAEAEISRRLRTRQMMTRARIEATSRYVKLPAGWRKAWNVQRVADDYPLEYLAPVEMDKLRHAISQNLVTAPPACSYYSLFGNTIEFLPEPTSADPVNMEMLYYIKIPSLTEETDSNWLLRTHPDLYLYGALMHSAPFLRDDERVGLWKQLFEDALASANIEDVDSKRSGAPMTRPTRSF